MKAPNSLVALLASCVLMTSDLCGQQNVPPGNLPAPGRMKLAGELIERDGKKRTLGLTIALSSLFIGGLIVAQSDGEDAPVAAGSAFIGIGAVTSIVLNFGAAKQAKKAGRVMQGL